MWYGHHITCVGCTVFCTGLTRIMGAELEEASKSGAHVYSDMARKDGSCCVREIGDEPLPESCGVMGSDNIPKPHPRKGVSWAEICYPYNPYLS